MKNKIYDNVIETKITFMNNAGYFKEKLKLRKLTDKELKQQSSWYDGSYQLHELFLGDRCIKPASHAKDIFNFLSGIMFCVGWVRCGKYFTDNLYKANEVFEILNNHRREI